MHRIDARAQKKVAEELGNAFKRVDGKENLLFKIEAALSEPSGVVERVVYPAVRGGEQTLKELVHEYKTKGPVYRRTVQTTLCATWPCPAVAARSASSSTSRTYWSWCCVSWLG